MDSVKAFQLATELIGKSVGGCVVDALIGSGKSAAVFEGTIGSRKVALKVFDDEIIKKYGGDTQLGRIERELELIGKNHPNLVKIINGGIDPTTGNHFIIMEFLNGPNLKECLNKVRVEHIESLIAQLAAAAKFLEEHGYCHRDIKPENIVLVDNYTRLILLDFGVLRPLADSSLTDAGGVQSFVGTLQYSSPEFLLRHEEDSPEGWRALTFYQMGGVLHDMIMRKPLFADVADPYARLVNAVQHETPQIQNSVIPTRLIGLARSCLLKNWRSRLQFVSWSSFDYGTEKPTDAGSARQRVTNRSALLRAAADDSHNMTRPNEAASSKKLQKDISEYLVAAIRSARSDNPDLPPFKIVNSASPNTPIVVKFSAERKFGLQLPLIIGFQIDIINGVERAAFISSAISFGDPAPNDWRSAPWEIIYSGVSDAAAIEGTVQQTLYTAFDRAQQVSEATNLETSSIWLDLNGGG